MIDQLFASYFPLLYKYILVGYFPRTPEEEEELELQVPHGLHFPVAWGEIRPDVIPVTAEEEEILLLVLV